MSTTSRSLLAGLLAALGAAAACNRPPIVLTQLIEARRLAADMRAQFAQAAEAANRAVMSESDEGSAEAADQARLARLAVERDVEALGTILTSLGYTEDRRVLDGFVTQFAEYRQLDDEVLPLAVENTNLKAQRLSFGPAREAAEAFREALDAAVKTAPCQAEALALRAVGALGQVQVLQAPHIAEADLTAMTRMEAQMAASEAEARTAVQRLAPVLPRSAAPRLAEATAALDRFAAINRDLLVLSRRNSNVQSLALSLGRKRVVAAACQDRLRELEQALAAHAFTATR